MSRKTKLILIFIICVLLFASCILYYKHHEQKYEVVFFDIGQGDATLINLSGDNEILIDGGPDMKILYKLGKYLPIYNRDIELMILTHPHSDHVNGLVDVLNRYKVEKIMYTGVKYDSSMYQEFLESIGRDAIHRVSMTDKINLDENNFLEIIYPWEDFEGMEFKNQNDNSIVVKLITENGFDFLFMGDIEMNIEEEILQNIEHENLQANVLKAGHHGSDTSSGEEFLQMVSPEKAIISCGKDNNFGHPSLRTIRRLERMGIEVFRTDEDGDVIIKIKDEKLKIKN